VSRRHPRLGRGVTRPHIDGCLSEGHPRSRRRSIRRIPK
jgi:hypothetical protein